MSNTYRLYEQFGGYYVDGRALIDFCEDNGINFIIYGENGTEAKEWDAWTAYHSEAFKQVKYVVVNSNTIIVFFHTVWH